MAWDQRGRLVGVMMEAAEGLTLEPRGLRFVGSDLLISNGLGQGGGTLLRSTVDDFGLPDCNQNSIPDQCEIADGAVDCNENRVLDECELDCNANRIPDECDLSSDLFPDCNRSFIPDECETDSDGDGFPDECDQAGDFDHDTDVDLDDFKNYVICGAGSGPGVPNPSAECRGVFDIDVDDDLDLRDFAQFQIRFSGPKGW